MQTEGRKGFPVALLGTAVITLALDQLSKALIRILLPQGEAVSLGGFGEIRQLRNPGTAFGIIEGRSWPLFLASIAVFVILVAVLWRWGGPGTAAFQVGLGLIIGGALGNIIDRIALGAVVDFVDLGFWPMRSWPVFNLADLAIVAGVGMILIIVVKDSFKRPRQLEVGDSTPPED
ncbi:MAG: signal peptidase II [Actinomycetota bacterium]